MKVCLVAHGYPPELVGGTELSVQTLACGLARQGLEVIVVAGSIRHEQGFRVSEEADGDVRVLRIHRDDLYFEHWQKSASVRVAEAFARILADESVDLVHVHHWIRLTRDLVAVAARAGVPSVVTLHDLWTSCLVSHRVPPGTDEFCEAPLAPSPCIACAEGVPPRTPWVPLEGRFMALAQRRGDLVRELELARCVVVPTRAHGDAVCRYLGVDAGTLGLRVVPHGRELALGAAPAREPDGRLVLGSWGHVHALKGQDLMLEALRGLSDPDRVTLHLAGGTPDPAFVERLERDARGLDVQLHGPFELETLGTHPVARVDAMLSASRGHESWGLVVDEAAALGLPMILPASGAFLERLPEGGGAFFFRPRDAVSLGEVLERLLAHPALLLQAREALAQQHGLVPSMEHHLRTMESVYQEAVGLGAPEVPALDWWEGRLRETAEREWDESLGRRSAQELGFE